MATSNEARDPAIRVRLLGGVAATVDGKAIDLGPPKCHALLAALALATGTTVPVARLVDLIWGPDAPRTAEKTLQTYVVLLRKRLGPGSVDRVGAGYRLNVTDDCVDVRRFQRLVEVGDVDAALAEWSGDPLAGLDAPGMNAVVDGLREQWAAATEAALRRSVDADPRSAVGELTRLTAEHPFRERLWQLLMTALYRAGRQADALTAFQTARSHLVDELGVEPGPALRELEQAILEQRVGVGHAGTDSRTGPQAAAGTTGGAAPAAATIDELPLRGRLPRRLPRLVGRGRELDAIRDAVGGSPLVTLVGPGGIGKTRLALAAADVEAAEFRDGACMVDLSEVRSGRDVARAFVDALGSREHPSRSAEESVVADLRVRQMLVIVDNCEHVVEDAARLARLLVEQCPEVSLLATSREPLGLAPERVVAVAPLEPAGAAAELFEERAAALGGDIDAVRDRDAVVEICRRLDGVPLAIELAAARTLTLTATQLRDRLDDRLRLLVGGRRDRVERQRTLRATLQWSYDLLTPEQQQLLARLSVFTGPFDLTAAEWLAVDAGADAVDIDERIGRLVDQSLLTVQPAAERRRFRMLETIRQYAAERLEESGTAGTVFDLHTAWCRAEVEAIHEQLAGHEELAGVHELENLWPDLRSAVARACERGDPVTVRALVEPIAGEVLLRSRQEIGDWAERVLPLAGPDQHDLTVFALVWAAHRYVLSQDRAAYERLVEEYGEPDDPLVRHARAFLYEDWGALLDLVPQAMAERRAQGRPYLAELMETDILAAHLNLGHFAEHAAVAETLAHRYRTDGPPTLLNWTLMLRGYGASFEGDQELAEQVFIEAATVPVPPRTHTPTTAIEARLAFERGDRRQAFDLLRRHIDELLETGNMQGVGVAAIEFVNILTAGGLAEEAAPVRRYLEASPLLESDFFRGLLCEAPPDLREHAEAPPDDKSAAATMLGVLHSLLQRTPT